MLPNGFVKLSVAAVGVRRGTTLLRRISLAGGYGGAMGDDAAAADLTRRRPAAVIWPPLR
uniref:Uncharacterized protein n=1 Tax=Ficus carica TaxID=3494 RepID=A0AA88JBD0_FICCA|nr:hypothetical protein TIFTF001_055839 [Ficus carica]